MSSQIIKRGIQTASTKLAGHGTAATAGHASEYCQICDCIIVIFQKIDNKSLEKLQMIVNYAKFNVLIIISSILTSF